MIRFSRHRTHPSQVQSYMNIYGQREQVPGSIIIDGGSGYCKFGWSKFDSPSGQSATFLEFGNIESPMYSRLRHFFATIYSRAKSKAEGIHFYLSFEMLIYVITCTLSLFCYHYTNFNHLHGGLNKLAEILEVERIGVCHKAGSDSLLTSRAFKKLKESYFNGNTDKYAGVLYGLGVEDDEK